MNTEPSVLVEREGRIGRILLNRPSALNAVDLEMIRAIRDALETWRKQPDVHAVVIEGAGDRAFCSGGDIRAVRAAVLRGDHAAVETFFTEEYALNLRDRRISETLCCADRRRVHGRRHRHLRARQYPRGDRGGAARHAGDRDRHVPRYRCQLFPAAPAGPFSACSCA